MVNARTTQGHNRENYQASSRQQMSATHSGGRQHRQVQSEQVYHESAQTQSRKGSGWKIVLQFVLGLAVIVVVAAAIVWLYVRYYQ